MQSTQLWLIACVMHCMLCLWHNCSRCTVCCVCGRRPSILPSTSVYTAIHPSTYNRQAVQQRLLKSLARHRIGTRASVYSWPTICPESAVRCTAAAVCMSPFSAALFSSVCSGALASCAPEHSGSQPVQPHITDNQSNHISLTTSPITCH